MPAQEIHPRQAEAPQPPADANLIARYKHIGLAAVNAALSCRPKKPEPAPDRHPSYEPRDES